MYNTYIAYTSRGPGAGSALKDFVEFVLISVFNRTHTLTSLLHSLHMGEGCRESGGGGIITALGSTMSYKQAERS